MGIGNENELVFSSIIAYSFVKGIGFWDWANDEIIEEKN